MKTRLLAFIGMPIMALGIIMGLAQSVVHNWPYSLYYLIFVATVVVLGLCHINRDKDKNKDKDDYQT